MNSEPDNTPVPVEQPKSGEQWEGLNDEEFYINFGMTRKQMTELPIRQYGSHPFAREECE